MEITGHATCKRTFRCLWMENNFRRYDRLGRYYNGRIVALYTTSDAEVGFLSLQCV